MPDTARRPPASGLEREHAVKVRHLIASALTAAVAITLTGCGDDSSGDSGKPKDLTVWLMTGTVPDPVLAEINKEWEDAHKGAKVKVEIQQWDGIGPKTTTALAGNDAPDVLEIGNTLTAGFADSGALADLTDKKGDLGGDDWNKGLEESGTYDGKLYGVPFYAGCRVVLYNKDEWAAAGLKDTPKTIDEFTTAATTLQSKKAAVKDYSGFYIPGKYWYQSMSFVFGYGGKIAEKDGDKWVGKLSSPESVKGLEAYKALAAKVSKAPKDATEADPQQFSSLAQGKSGTIYDAGWQVGSIEKENPKLTGKIGSFALPGPSADSAMPAFLGGSNLAIAEKSDNQDGAYDYLKLLAGAKYQQKLVDEAGLIPNTNALLETAKSNPKVAAPAAAAENGWFVPNSPKWGDVEASNALTDLTVNIFTGKKSVADAAKDADKVIEEQLNS
jgi:N,N'-diacetylchitobiose transport system substrate-binding protein